jgi:hypothetical protein
LDRGTQSTHDPRRTSILRIRVRLNSLTVAAGQVEIAAAGQVHLLQQDGAILFKADRRTATQSRCRQGCDPPDDNLYPTDRLTGTAASAALSPVPVIDTCGGVPSGRTR